MLQFLLPPSVWYVFDYLVHLQMQILLPFWSNHFVFHYLVHLQLPAIHIVNSLKPQFP